MTLTRRRFLRTLSVGTALGSLRPLDGACGAVSPPSLAGAVGVTTSSFSGHLAATSSRKKFTLLELPRLMRDELGMRVIDLNTSSLASMDEAYLDRLRDAAEKAGCVFTNLKMNQRDLDMNSPDAATRREALRQYKRSIDAATRLGCRWARPLPSRARPEMRLHVASYQELADYGAGRKVELLVENFGWMQSDPESVVRLVHAVGRNVAACPDTGNWANDAIRREGLEKTFPHAVTCDFKARRLGPNGEHELYDLRQCFDIGWKAGFRGPWCLEHAHPDRAQLFKELAILRDMLRRWMV